MSVGLLLTSFAFGLRHGVDWDHIAAIADLSSSGESRRQGFALSTIYALGHAVVVLVLGIVAIAVGAAIPEGLDAWMGRVVGFTLVALGAWILLEIVRHKSDFRLRSRWILILDGTFAGVRKVRQSVQGRRVSIDHDHAHDHTGSSVLGEPDHESHYAHDHAHLQSPHTETEAVLDLTEPARVDAGSKAGSSGHLRSFFERGRQSHAHHHGHHHELALADDQKTSVGNGTAAGIGMLHGIGIESPTQIAVFVASTAAVGWVSGVALLIAWCAGLVIANAGLALLAGFGMLHAERNFAVYVTVALLVAVSSIAMGVLLITGIDALPAINL